MVSFLSLFFASLALFQIGGEKKKEKQHPGETLSHVDIKDSLVAYCFCLKILRNLLVLEKLIMQIPVTHADPSFLWLYSFAAACFYLGKDNKLVQSGLEGSNTSNFTGCEV